jgi:hypothetical protein
VESIVGDDVALHKAALVDVAVRGSDYVHERSNAGNP